MGGVDPYFERTSLMFNPLKFLPSGLVTKKDKLDLRLSSAALRVPTGAYILNAGLGKFQADKEGAEGLRDMAVDGIPQLGQIDAENFATGLASAETALGAALLCPLIPNRVVGLGLTAFGAGLLTMYFGGDQYTEDDGIRPSDAGKAIAKDSWLVGAGLALAALPRK